MGKRLSEICNLEIINVYDGGKYGYIGSCELIFNKLTGEITSILVNEEKATLFSFKTETPVEIQWSRKIKVCDRTIIFDSEI